MTVWFGVYTAKGRLVAVEEGEHTAWAVAERLTAATKVEHTARPVEVKVYEGKQHRPPDPAGSE